MFPNKNPSQWINNTVNGGVSSAAGSLQAQNSTTLTTQAGVSLDLNPNLITARPDSAWSPAARVDTAWMQPQNTTTITVGTENMITNLGSFLVDNLGNFLVTTTTYQHPKYATAWSEAAAA